MRTMMALQGHSLVYLPRFQLCFWWAPGPGCNLKKEQERSLSRWLQMAAHPAPTERPQFQFWSSVLYPGVSG